MFSPHIAFQSKVPTECCWLGFCLERMTPLLMPQYLGGGSRTGKSLHRKLADSCGMSRQNIVSLRNPKIFCAMLKIASSSRGFCHLRAKRGNSLCYSLKVNIVCCHNHSLQPLLTVVLIGGLSERRVLPRSNRNSLSFASTAGGTALIASGTEENTFEA